MLCYFLTGPGHRMLPPFGRYHNILLGDTGKFARTTWTEWKYRSAMSGKEMTQISSLYPDNKTNVPPNGPRRKTLPKNRWQSINTLLIINITVIIKIHPSWQFEHGPVNLWNLIEMFNEAFFTAIPFTNSSAVCYIVHCN